MTELPESSRSVSIDDAPKIEAAILQLSKLGFKPLFPQQEFAAIAHEKAEELEGIGIPDPPFRLTWADLALDGSKQVFANAYRFEERRFDDAAPEDYTEVVALILALAGDEWPDATVSATRVVSKDKLTSERMQIAIEGPGGAAPFDLVVDSYFDWSVVTRLNERLPLRATGRFAAFFDSAVTIVYLRQDQLEQLSELFGFHLVLEVEPLEPRQNFVETTVARSVQGGAPIWLLVIGLLMGIFAASELIAMISKGAPYTIPGRDLTPIALSDAPLEFLLVTTIYVFGAVGFILAPLFQIGLRIRGRRQREASDPD